MEHQSGKSIPHERAATKAPCPTLCPPTTAHDILCSTHLVVTSGTKNPKNMCQSCQSKALYCVTHARCGHPTTAAQAAQKYIEHSGRHSKALCKQGCPMPCKQTRNQGRPPQQAKVTRYAKCRTHVVVIPPALLKQRAIDSCIKAGTLAHSSPQLKDGQPATRFSQISVLDQTAWCVHTTPLLQPTLIKVCTTTHLGLAPPPGRCRGRRLPQLRD